MNNHFRLVILLAVTKSVYMVIPAVKNHVSAYIEEVGNWIFHPFSF